MKLFKALLQTTTLLAIVAAPLSASSYVARANSPGYSVFGFSSFSSSTASPLPTTTATSTSTSSSALQTSSCLYNSCGGSAPGVTTASTPPVAAAFTLGPTVTNYSAFSGAVTRYSVFGMYNFRPTTFGSTQQPSFSGGLTSGNVLADPLANPEPTSIVLFGAGLLALGWASRRRQANKA